MRTLYGTDDVCWHEIERDIDQFWCGSNHYILLFFIYLPRKRTIHFKGALSQNRGSLRPDHALATALYKYDGLSEDIRESGMHLITNYPLMTETPWIEAQKDTNKSRLWERQLEIEEVLPRNLNNTLVTTAHLLVNQPSAEKRLYKLSFHNKRKIVVRRIESLPKYKNFFDYINEKILNRFVVMLNMDIYVGEGFERIRTVK